MPFAPAQQSLGLALEATRGTGLVPTFWYPIDTPQYVPVLGQIEDKALRGSMVDVYDLVQGIRHDELDFGGPVFLDTIGNLCRGVLGSFDNETGTATGSGNTTLASAYTAPATTISTVATIPASTIIQVDTAGLSEVRTTTAVSGAGPFTVTLNAPLSINHASAATVVPVTGAANTNIHNFSLLNNAYPLGNQPPSYTATYSDGFTGFQMPGGQMDSLDLTFSSNALVTFKNKILGLPATLVAPTIANVTTADAIPGWNATVTIAGSGNGKMSNGTLTLSRGVKPIETVGNITPGPSAVYRLWSSVLTCKGKLTMVMEDNTELNYYLNSTKPSLDLKWTEPVSLNTWELHLNSAMMRTGKITPSKEFIETDLEWEARPNTTDAIAGGLSPLKITLTNSVANGY